MKLRTFSSLKFIVILPLTVLLTLSLLSANFYDPTFFHQLNPERGIQNWCGTLGAYLGGTLIELFGPATFLVPWFVLKLSFSSQNYIRRISTTYYAVILLFSACIAHQLWWPISSAELTNSSFLRYPGYAGILGAQWLEKTLGFGITNILTGAMVVYCAIKLFDELPFKMLFSIVLSVTFFLPYYLLKQIWRPLTRGNSFNLSTPFSWLKSSLSSFRSPSPFDPDSPSSNPMLKGEEHSH